MPRITVLGSLNMDISVAVPRLPAPGETVLGSGAVIAPGGKGANQAVAAARLGGTVRMIGCTGDDEFGRMARSALEAEGVDADGVRAVAGSATGLALITVDAAGENVITVAPGANGLVGDDEAAAALSAAPDLLVLSAEIPAGVLAAVLAGARTAGVTCLLNLAPAPPGAGRLLAGGVGWLVVNESEAAAVLGHAVAGLAEAGAAARGGHCGTGRRGAGFCHRGRADPRAGGAQRGQRGRGRRVRGRAGRGAGGRGGARRRGAGRVRGRGHGDHPPRHPGRAAAPGGHSRGHRPDLAGPARPGLSAGQLRRQLRRPRLSAGRLRRQLSLGRQLNLGRRGRPRLPAGLRR
jgi:sugar/nucleoside kinase (ribokinase family)